MNIINKNRIWIFLNGLFKLVKLILLYIILLFIINYILLFLSILGRMFGTILRITFLSSI